MAEPTSQAPKRRIKMPARSASSVSMDSNEVADNLRKLTSAISEIHQHNASHLSFEELYRTSYNLVMHKDGMTLYQLVGETLEAHFVNVRDSLRMVAGPALLDAVACAWKDHVREISMVSDVLMYLDKTWVPQQQGVKRVTEMGHGTFISVVVQDGELAPRITDLLLDALARHRAGELVDLSTVRVVYRMFVELGTAESAVEVPVLAASEAHFAKTSMDQLSTSTCSEYCVFADNKLTEEHKLAEQIFPELDARLNRLVLRELIVKHASTLVDMPQSGFLWLIRENKTEELKLLFTLLESGIGSSAFTDCAALFQEFMEQSGTHIVNDEPQSAAQMVEALMEEKDKCDAICQTSFRSHKMFAKAIKEAFEGFMNVSVKCASLLAVYTDELLAGKREAKTNLDSQLDRVIGLFRFLSDKDVFEVYYKVHFSKRLLGQKSCSQDAERSMILKMKSECGGTFTSKLEGMFKDMSLAQEASNKFEHDSSIDFSIQVLTSGFWPTSVNASFSPVLPQEMAGLKASFDSLYLSMHTGRKIEWNHLLGSCEVRATGFADGEAHDFVVSPLQAMLMLALQGEKKTFGELQRATDIPVEELKRQLISMCVSKYQVFNKLQGSKHDFQDEHEYEFNSSFKSKLRKVRIPTVVMQSASQEEKMDVVPGFVFEARNHVMDAGIVRVMKSRKSMEHNLLVAEVITHLQFKPSMSDLKKRIEALIEREYLERDPSDMRVYLYVA